MSERTARLDELMREEISAVIQREVDDPRIGFVTITDVEVAPDLRHASVWVSVIGSADEKRQTLRALSRAMPFVRQRLGKLRLKRIPELHVKDDDTARRGTRVLQILDELDHGREGELPELPETLPTPAASGARATAEAGARGARAAAPKATAELRDSIGNRAPRVETGHAHQAETVTAVAAAAAALTSLTANDVAAVPSEVVSRIKGARTVLTVCHENPEADALGSALAVALAVEELGGRATPVCADPVPQMYDFMPRIERFRQDPDPELDYDLIVVGDCGDLERIGPVLQRHAELFGRVPIVDIDHHVSNMGFGVVDWIDATAAATCEMDTLLMPALGVPLTSADGAIAAALIAGVVIDTANFQHPNVTPRTLRVAAELVAAGAPLALTARLLYRTKPNRQLQLFGRVLGRLQTELDGRLVWSAVDDADFAETATTAEDAEGLSDLLSQSAEGALVILFRQNGDRTKISVRTREGGPDATVLTGTFGGGGHARAAGATVAMPLAEAEQAVLAEARRMLREDGG